MSDECQPEVDFLHHWEVVFIRENRLSNTNLLVLRHKEGRRPYFGLTCISQRHLCLSPLFTIQCLIYTRFYSATLKFQSLYVQIFSEECSSHWSLVRCEEAQNQCLFGRISLQNWDARDRRWTIQNYLSVVGHLH